MSASFFALFLFSCILMIPLAYAAVSKCYNAEMKEQACEPPNNVNCHSFECEKGVARGCGTGPKDEMEKQGLGPAACDFFEFGAYKPGTVAVCYTDLCTGDAGNRKAGVSKCYDLDMKEQICKAPNNEQCHSLECEHGVARGCGFGTKDKMEEIGTGVCQQLGKGDYKPGTVSVCHENMCNDNSGK